MRTPSHFTGDMNAHLAALAQIQGDVENWYGKMFDAESNYHPEPDFDTIVDDAMHCNIAGILALMKLLTDTVEMHSDQEDLLLQGFSMETEGGRGKLVKKKKIDMERIDRLNAKLGEGHDLYEHLVQAFVKHCHGEPA